MSIKNFLGKIGSKHPEAEKSPADSPEDQAPVVQGAETASAGVQLADESQELIRRLLEAIQRQDKQIEGLIRELGALSGATDKLAAAGGSQDNLADAMREALARLEDRRDEASSAVLDTAENCERQTELLCEIRDKLDGTAAPEKDTGQLTDALKGLVSALDNVNNNSAAQKESLEQIRTRIGRATEDTGEILISQGRKLTRYLAIIVGAILALSGAILLHGILVR